MDYLVEEVRSIEIWRDFAAGNSEPKLLLECSCNLSTLENCKYSKVDDQISEVHLRVCCAYDLSG